MPDAAHDMHGTGFRPSDEHLYNDMAECALLGALLTKPDLLAALPAWFEAGHYGHALHGDIHRILVEVGQPGVPALMQVQQMLSPEDRGALAHLAASVVSYAPGSIPAYAGVVTEMHRRRGLVALADQVQAAMRAGGEASADGAIALAMNTLDRLTAQRADAQPHTMMAEAADAALRAYDRAARGEGPTGLSTGFASIDEALGGLEAGCVYVLAGRPGMGKSALGHQVALAVAKAGHGVLEVSLEMSATALGRRTLSALSGVPLAALKRGTAGQGMARLMEARRALQGLPLSIEDGGGLTAGMIALKARAAKRRHGLGLIMIDHIHIVRPDDADVRQGATWAVGRVSGAMKRLAKDMDCAVLLLAQLNRGVEAREDKRPGLGDLRQSGDIEQDADAVCFVYRPEYYLGSCPERGPSESLEKHANAVARWEADRVRLKGKAELILAKVRDGAPGMVELRFEAATTSFAEPDARADADMLWEA